MNEKDVSNSNVKIVEVGPRDGLQNEKKILDLSIKLKFINDLINAGCRYIEVGSFVSPRWVPQMANTIDLVKQLRKHPNVTYSCLVPNLHGLQDALTTDLLEIAVFTTVSETFSIKNTNRSIAKSLDEIAKIIDVALAHNLKVRGYLSCVPGCPYEGKIAVSNVVAMTERLYQLGCYEISLGDTIGVGTPYQTKQLINAVADVLPLSKVALHAHDTFGQALANIFAAYDEGIKVFDSSVAGLGGCPYAKGASGNVATEDVVYMFEGMGVKTGIVLKDLVKAGRDITRELVITPHSKVNQAWQFN